MQWSEFSFQLIFFLSRVFNFMTISWCWSMATLNLNPLYCCYMNGIGGRNRNSCLSCWCPSLSLHFALPIEREYKKRVVTSTINFGPRVLQRRLDSFDTKICKFTSDIGFERSTFIWTDTHTHTHPVGKLIFNIFVKFCVDWRVVCVCVCEWCMPIGRMRSATH